MKKVVSFMLALSCLCIFSSLPAGCGSSAVMQDALELFETSRQTFKTADSVQMEVVCDVKVEYAEGTPDAVRMAFTRGATEMFSLVFRMESQRVEGGLWVTHINLSGREGDEGPSGSTGGTDAFAYGDRIYVEVSPGQWYYQDNPGLADVQSGGQGITPASIERYMELCESVEVVGESGKTVTYALVLGEKYFDRMAAEIQKVQGPAAGEAQQELIKIQELLKDAGFYITVDKSTGYPASGDLVIRIEVPDFIRMIDPDLKDRDSSMIIDNTGGSYVVMEYGYTFSRYGEDLRVILPQKVIETAQPLPDKAEQDSPG